MSNSLNVVTLIGNLGNSPEIKTFENGGRVANLSLATSESWKDRNTGEKKDRIQWHRIVVNVEGLVKLCENYIKKGSKLYIEGQLETRKYTDNSGIEKYTTEVVLRPYNSKIIMLDSRNTDSVNNTSAQAKQEMDISAMDDIIPF